MVKVKRSKHNLKILIDTNVLFSAILFEKSQVAKAVFYANEKYEVYLSDQNIQEHDLDIILTGDKDFLVLDLDRPKCMTVKEFLQKY